MVAFPPCKINLGLSILRKRGDGFHDLSTCFFPVPWNDILEIIPSNVFKFSSSGLTIPGNTDENLCVKAYEILQRDFKLDPVHIHLHKIIPMGAGLGGGSSDAAWTLRILDSVFSLSLSTEKLMQYASMLGSDCAFFIQDNAMMGSGRGEVLSPCAVDLKGKWIVLVKPDVHVSTADAYAGVIPKETNLNLQSVLETKSITEWRDVIKNDFEDSVFQKYPVIAAVKDQLYRAGALYASMSGSGSTVFGIFEEEINVKLIFKGLASWSGKV